MCSNDLGHVQVIDWVTIPQIDNKIAVIIEKKDALVRVIIWNDYFWSACADWIFATMVVSMEVASDDPRLPNAQREWSRRQVNEIHRTGWMNEKE